MKLVRVFTYCFITHISGLLFIRNIFQQVWVFMYCFVAHLLDLVLIRIILQVIKIFQYSFNTVSWVLKWLGNNESVVNHIALLHISWVIGFSSTAPSHISAFMGLHVLVFCTSSRSDGHFFRAVQWFFRNQRFFDVPWLFKKKIVNLLTLVMSLEQFHLMETNICWRKYPGDIINNINDTKTASTDIRKSIKWLYCNAIKIGSL